MIHRPELVPSLVAPASSIIIAVSRLLTPPDALTCIFLTLTGCPPFSSVFVDKYSVAATMSRTCGKVAPGPLNPVEVFMKSKFAAAARWLAARIWACESWDVSRMSFRITGLGQRLRIEASSVNIAE